MQKLGSYLAETWQQGTGTDYHYANAVTGEALGEASASGLDIGEAIRFGRQVGGSELRSLTFHQRGALLKDLGKLLLSDEAKDPLYELSALTGATRSDSAIDIDGGASVLLTYASKSRKELPNATSVIDGDVEALSRDGSFLGVHLLTSRRGIDVQINAYNFPVWGMLEKLAPAILAGVPTLVKPAPQTAFVTEAAVRMIIDSGILPAGTLQLLCGSPHDLLDLLDGRDSVTFTGSAQTGRHLRSHPGLVENSVRLSVEADSLNSAILAPSVESGSAEFDLLVGEVVKELTTKAGQKCTAIRRVFVPSQLMNDVEQALAAALAEVVVGDPGSADTDMGALVSLEQRDTVRKAIAELSGATGTVVDTCAFHDVDPEAGAFMAPTLLRAVVADAPAIHTVEAFGPVATLVPYDSIEQCSDLVAQGKGSLVASVFTADPAEAARIVPEIASGHGRVLVVDESIAASSTGHGSPLPHLVHGGPGRAGGGQELGGRRGVVNHMQLTAIQGSPSMLTAITGEFVAGAPRTSSKGHPFTLTFDELEIGDSITTGTRLITHDDIANFAETTGDKFYAHVDDEAAKRSPIFGGLVAHGYLVLSYAAGLFVWPDEGPVLANYGIDRLRFLTPTYPNDEIHVILTCKRKTRLDGRGYGEVAWDTEVINQGGEVVAAYDVLTMVANAPGINGAPS